MKEVKEKGKNRRSCCERYVVEYMCGTMSTDLLMQKMKVNPQLHKIVDAQLSNKKRELINIPMEMWNGHLNGCVERILETNERYSHIAKYLNAVHKGRINSSLYVMRNDYKGKPVTFGFEGARFVADFIEDRIKIESINREIKNFIIY